MLFDKPKPEANAEVCQRCWAVTRQWPPTLLKPLKELNSAVLQYPRTVLTLPLPTVTCLIHLKEH